MNVSIYSIFKHNVAWLAVCYRISFDSCNTFVTIQDGSKDVPQDKSNVSTTNNNFLTKVSRFTEERFLT